MIRNYLYFDRLKIERYLSSLQDGIIEERRTKTETKGPRVTRKIDLKVASVGGEKESKIHTVDEIKKLSDTSLFERLEILLGDSNSEIISLPIKADMAVESFVKGMKRGTVIHLSGKVEISAIDRLMIYLNSKIDALKSRTPSLENSKEMISSFLSNFLSVNISVKNPSSVVFLSRLNRKHIECEIEELNDELEVFGRVRQVLQKGQRLKLYSLSGNISLPKRTIEQFMEMFSKNLEAMEMLGIPKPLTIDKFEIRYPAIEIDPAVIYW